MEKNIGTTERYVRFGLGAVAGYAAFKMRKSKLASGLLASLAASAFQSGVTQHCALKDKLGIGEKKSSQGKVRYAPEDHELAHAADHQNHAQSGAI